MHTRTTLLLTGALLAASATLLGQGKPPKGGNVTTVPATATFRCDYGPEADPTTTCLLQSDDSVVGGADRLRSDGAPGYTGGLGSLTFYYKSASPRTMRLYLGTPQSGTRECATSTTAGCNLSLVSTGIFDDGLTTLDDFELHIKPLVPGTLDDFTGGPANMGCFAANARPALLHLTVRMAGVEGHWGLNYNKRAYHSTNVLMTRTGTYTWTVETVPPPATPATPNWTGTLAELIAFNHSGIQGNKGPSHEGLFDAPFKLSIDSLGKLPTASTVCQVP